MLAESIKFRGHRCFKGEWAGFDTIKPINVIIGRNNTGKSHLLDLVQSLCNQNSIYQKGWHYLATGILDQPSLAQSFRADTSQGQLGGNHWANHGAHLVDSKISWEVTANGQVTDVVLPANLAPSQWGSASDTVRLNVISHIAGQARHIFSSSTFRRLLADRDIQPEGADTTISLQSNGGGATNVIRRYLTSSSPKFPRELIQNSLLGALNEVFGPDGEFTEIEVKLHDENNPDTSHLNAWEVYLAEKKKGLISLSKSGSGLKTVILTLLNLLVIPEIERKAKKEYVFAFEELENNLHPALLRRLFQFLERYAVKELAPIFLTTHSSTALDLFGVSKNAQIIHVTHNGEEALAVTVGAHFDHLGVISELGAKPSDLLQANGIIWVEGPSDCIYINRWLDLYSGGKFQEGRDYQCAFYGGSLLARTQFKSPEDAERELVNLFRVNPNVIVVCDGDRSGKGSRVKDRVRRIRAEVLKIPGAHIWVTDAREIENYLPGSVLEKATGLSSLPDPTQFQMFFPRKGSSGTSYVESKLHRKGIDKMELAILAVPHMDKATMETRFEWKDEMKLIFERISAWNRS